MKTLFRNLCLLGCLVAGQQTTAQVIARYTVQAGDIARHNSVVHIPLDQPADTEDLLLEEVAGKKRTPVAVTAANGELWWILEGHTPAGARRFYELKRANRKTSTVPVMQVTDANGALVLQQGLKHILQYNYATVEPPAGSDSVYRRSAFIHPLWAPNGAVLTNAFPNAGHRHHMGIWNPWTHTLFEGKETDFWNVQKKEGKVRFVKMESVTNGNAWCGFSARQDHVAFGKNGSEKVAINETWKVRAYPSTNNGQRRCWDITSLFHCATEEGITLLQYRYGGGFGLRTTPFFTASTSEVLTSEGKTRKNADSTRARWVKITGVTPEGKSGLLIMNAPDNYDSPEPLRVWPENMEGGELMLNYSPTKMKEWKLTNGNNYTLTYRVMVYDGDITPEEAEAAWKDFAFPPVVRKQ
ncbi:PmoA family protein [Chitinophaga qingshengii]|uniref:PmoA family protein n=1 Tax=Chitinophaga qingshengii TaxID=1569794 RepID=A0ABR7TI73_9BACT|nr:PmoA family protein [Chitinophaga qingshengii]MBC9930212.1 PmoA family protein [Chitinophaga qingshengii]